MSFRSVLTILIVLTSWTSVQAQVYRGERVVLTFASALPQIEIQYDPTKVGTFGVDNAGNIRIAQTGAGEMDIAADLLVSGGSLKLQGSVGVYTLITVTPVFGITTIDIVGATPTMIIQDSVTINSTLAANGLSSGTGGISTTGAFSAGSVGGGQNMSLTGGIITVGDSTIGSELHVHALTNPVIFFKQAGTTRGYVFYSNNTSRVQLNRNGDGRGVGVDASDNIFLDGPSAVVGAATGSPELRVNASGTGNPQLVFEQENTDRGYVYYNHAQSKMFFTRIGGASGLGLDASDNATLSGNLDVAGNLTITGTCTGCGDGGGIVVEPETIIPMADYLGEGDNNYPIDEIDPTFLTLNGEDGTSLSNAGRFFAVGRTEGLNRDIEHFGVPIDFVVNLPDRQSGLRQSQAQFAKLIVNSYDNDPTDVRFRGGYPYCPTVDQNLDEVGISSLTRSGSTATLNTTSAHGFSSGFWVYVTGAVPSEYNGMFQITVSDSDTFTYTVSGSPSTPASASSNGWRTVKTATHCEGVTGRGATSNNIRGGIIGKIHYDILTDCSSLVGGVCTDGLFDEAALISGRVKETRNDGVEITGASDEAVSQKWSTMDFEFGLYPESWTDNTVTRVRMAGDGTVQIGGGGYGSANRLPYLAYGALTVFGGGIATRPIEAPGGLSCTPVGGGSGTTYYYRVVPITANGMRGPASAATTCENGASLSSTVYNDIKWDVVPGTEFYLMLRNIGSDIDPASATANIVKVNFAGRMCTANGSVSECQIGFGYVQGKGTDRWAIRGESGERHFHDTGPDAFDSDNRGGYTYPNSYDAPNRYQTGDLFIHQNAGISVSSDSLTGGNRDTTSQKVVFSTTMMGPPVNNDYQLGDSNHKWATIYASTTNIGDLFFDNNFALTETHYLGENTPAGLGIVDVRDPENPRVVGVIGEDGTFYVNQTKPLSELKLDMDKYRQRLKDVKFTTVK